MSKVYIVEYENNYGEQEILGICSTKEKAELTVEGMKEFDITPYQVREIELDAAFEEVKERLQQCVDDYMKTVSLLDLFKKLES